jgi:hypothetical protein
MIKNCPICGKLTCIHWPQFWPYVRGTAYYCSWTCMDVSLCRDMNLIKAADMRKRSKKNMKTIVTKEQKQKAVSMAIDGRDPLEYLREIGSKSPDKMWYQIKASVKESDPELYAKIPDLRKIEKKPEEVPVVKVDGALRIETPEAKQIQVAEVPEVKVEGPVHVKMPDAPIMLDEFQVTAIRSDKYGEFYYDKKYNCIDWRNEGGDEISLTPGGWADLAEDLPKILRALGVKL